MTHAQLAMVFRLSAKRIYWQAHDNTPGPMRPEEYAFKALYEEYTAIAEMLEGDPAALEVQYKELIEKEAEEARQKAEQQFKQSIRRAAETPAVKHNKAPTNPRRIVHK